MKALIRKLTAWAWAREIATTEGIATLEEMHLVPGSMDLHIKQNPHLAELIPKVFASMLIKSPNYTEMKFELVDREKFEWITVLIQKGSGKTPHGLRRIAEAERDELRRVLDASLNPPTARPAGEE